MYKYNGSLVEAVNQEMRSKDIPIKFNSYGERFCTYGHSVWKQEQTCPFCKRLSEIDPLPSINNYCHHEQQKRALTADEQETLRRVAEQVAEQEEKATSV